MRQDEGTRTLRLDGRAVAYDEAGSGPGAPLLLLHGFTGGRDDFSAVLAGLAEHRRAVAVDLPGHGDSQGSDDPGDYALPVLGGWVLRLAGALDLGDFHLLGHSMGGLVAQRVAASASQRLRSLVLADTGLGALREEAAERVVRIALAARDGGAGAPEPSRGPRPAAVVGGARILTGAEPVGAFLRGIDIPVLVVHGEGEEHWSTTEQHLLASTVAGAQRVVIPGAGHCPQRDSPEAWVAVVAGFLRAAET